jgi:hypothetical protein
MRVAALRQAIVWAEECPLSGKYKNHFVQVQEKIA